MNKINVTLNKIIKELRKVLKENPNFTGSVTMNFCLGGISNIEKRENLKIK